MRSGVFTPGDLNGEVSGPYWAQVLTQASWLCRLRQ